jgi:DNA-binding SARP family transcriptional activator
MVNVCDKELPGMGGRKGEELLAYLVLFRDRPHHREALSETLWGGDALDLDPKKHLRQALWQLRLAFRPSHPDPFVVLTQGEWLRLDPDAEIGADVWRLEEAVASTRGLPGEALDAALAEEVRRATDLYCADLLEGWYGDWCVYERERLRTVYLSALDKLLAYCEANGLPEEGLFYAERILGQDRAHERTHLRMMRLHLMAGDRTRALRQFDRCAAALREELGVEPGGAAIALREQIRDDTVVLHA